MLSCLCFLSHALRDAAPGGYRLLTWPQLVSVKFKTEQKRTRENCQILLNGFLEELGKPSLEMLGMKWRIRQSTITGRRAKIGHNSAFAVCRQRGGFTAKVRQFVYT